MIIDDDDDKTIKFPIKWKVLLTSTMEDYPEMSDIYRKVIANDISSIAKQV